MTPKGEKKTTARKKYVAKKVRQEIPCAHCGEIFSYPVSYCPICKQHGHQAIAGNDPRGCGSCRSGLSRSGQAHMRATRTWNGCKIIAAAYDMPEFYDGQQEISNMTLMPLWVTYESGNAH
jgi:hypothetical protein